jgi:hypothetical protein
LTKNDKSLEATGVYLTEKLPKIAPHKTTVTQTTKNPNKSTSPSPTPQKQKKTYLQRLPIPYPLPSPHKPSPGFLRWLQACHKLKLLPRRLLALHWDELLDLEYPLMEDPQVTEMEDPQGTEMEEMEEVEEILDHALLGALEADLLEEEGTPLEEGGTQEIIREELTN